MCCRIRKNDTSESIVMPLEPPSAMKSMIAVMKERSARCGLTIIFKPAAAKRLIAKRL